MSHYREGSIEIITKQSKRFKANTQQNYFRQNVSWEDMPLFFPPGLEKLFLIIYFVTLPYIAGLLFLYLYVSKGDNETFMVINQDASFFLTWAIGYEIIAALALLWIFKNAIKHMLHKDSRKKRKFQRP